MRHILRAAGLVLLTALSAGAQFDGGRGSFPGCPTCGVYSFVDLPQAEATVSASNFTLQGWGFECVSGRPVDRVDIWEQDYDGFWHPLKQADGALWFGYSYRPDVQAAYRGLCPNVSPLTGWVLTLTNPPALGLRRLRINLWYGPYFETSLRTYLVVR